MTEREGPGWEDERPWPFTVFDPFDVWGLVRGRDKKMQFWDMTDEELEQVRAQKLARKRSVLAGILDPFHLWGRRGYIGRHLAGRKGNAEPSVVGNGVEVRSGEMKRKERESRVFV